MNKLKKSQIAVSVIGLGNMGSALADAFLNAGYSTTVWNRTPEKADNLVTKGANLALSVNEAVQASPLIIACLLNYEALYKTVNEVGEVVTGKVWVNLNTGTPQDAKKAEIILKGLGAEYLDGAIMDIPQSIGNPETLIFYSGSEAAFKYHRSTLLSLGGKSVFLGPEIGLSKLYELSVGSILVPTLIGFLQGAALLKTVNVKAETLVPYSIDWLNMISSLLPKLAYEIDTESYETNIATLNVFTGISHDIEAYKAADIDVKVFQPMKELIEQGIASGYGSDSISRLIELMKSKHHS